MQHTAAYHGCTGTACTPVAYQHGCTPSSVQHGSTNNWDMDYNACSDQQATYMQHGANFHINALAGHGYTSPIPHGNDDNIHMNSLHDNTSPPIMTHQALASMEYVDQSKFDQPSAMGMATGAGMEHACYFEAVEAWDVITSEGVFPLRPYMDFQNGEGVAVSQRLPKISTGRMATTTTYKCELAHPQSSENMPSRVDGDVSGWWGPTAARCSNPSTTNTPSMMMSHESALHHPKSQHPYGCSRSKMDGVSHQPEDERHTIEHYKHHSLSNQEVDWTTWQQLSSPSPYTVPDMQCAGLTPLKTPTKAAPQQGCFCQISTPVCPFRETTISTTQMPHLSCIPHALTNPTKSPFAAASKQGFSCSGTGTPGGDTSNSTPTSGFTPGWYAPVVRCQSPPPPMITPWSPPSTALHGHSTLKSTMPPLTPIQEYQHQLSPSRRHTGDGDNSALITPNATAITYSAILDSTWVPVCDAAGGAITTVQQQQACEQHVASTQGRNGSAYRETTDLSYDNKAGEGIEIAVHHNTAADHQYLDDLSVGNTEAVLPDNFEWYQLLEDPV